MAKAIMVQGTMSNAGKSYLAAALCRIFKQDGYRVAPFKSQNMALNSFITEEGLEMGRAQVMQAEAAGIKPSVLMNPILLKPTNDTGSQVIVNGEVLGNMSARDYYKNKLSLVPKIMEAYNQLDQQYDIIVLEGAGSPAEINLKQDDIEMCIRDRCMCEYTSHGHCGVLCECTTVDNDKTLELLCKTALSHVRAGADMVAPSDMMDGRVLAIRRALDAEGYTHIPIMAYSAKYASAFYGPFRDAAGSAPSFGDRRSYQMDIHNRKEALKEIDSDVAEGADIVMVKPAPVSYTHLDVYKRQPVLSLPHRLILCCASITRQAKSVRTISSRHVS